MSPVEFVKSHCFVWFASAAMLVTTVPGCAFGEYPRENVGWISTSIPTGLESQESFVGPDSTQSITLPLSPMFPNIFNFGAHKFKVQYPSGQTFSGVDMTVTAVQLTPSAFAQRVAGTEFSHARCIVYTGEGGNCIDYQVTCSNFNHVRISCPRTPTPSIDVLSSFDTHQSIINPGFVTTPIGKNAWRNILDSFFLMKVDPTPHGHTDGFSEFVATSLGTTNPQGLATLAFIAPLRPSDPRTFSKGSSIPVNFTLTSVAHPGQPVTDALASLSVLMVEDGKGNPTSVVTFTRQNAFTESNGTYKFDLPAQTFSTGTYILTVYGNAFASQAVTFTIH